MEGKFPGVSFPGNLLQILSSLGITGKPTKWNICSTGDEFSLTLVWKQGKGKEEESYLSTTSNGYDSLKLEEPKEVFSTPNFTESQKNLGGNASMANFSGVTEISQNKNTVVRSSTFENGENSLRLKETIRKKLESSRLQHEAKRHKEFQRNVKVDVDHLPELSNSSLDNKAKAKCSCGEEFSFKERAIKHILFSCPVSLCFRIDLDLRINRAIDQWRDEEQRILGRKWWHAYKTSGFPDVRMSFPENALNELEILVNEFLAKAEEDKLTDKDKKQFVLMKGLKKLPFELEGIVW